MNALRNYPWPGNIRELMNVVQRLLILNRGDEITEAEVEQTLGARPIEEARESADIIYYSRYYRAREGAHCAVQNRQKPDYFGLAGSTRKNRTEYFCLVISRAGQLFPS